MCLVIVGQAAVVGVEMGGRVVTPVLTDGLEVEVVLVGVGLI